MTTNIPVPRLGGVNEVAGELGVSRQQVAKLRQSEDFPAPLATLSFGDVWDLDVIGRWAKSGLRRRAGRPAAEAQRLAVGRRYELIDKLGDGGFAVVYRARDLLEANLEVAVKVLKDLVAVDDWSVKRFERELQVMSQIRHPHVMPVLASGTDERFGIWYAMPLALGSLADLATSALDDEQITDVMRDVCAGLAHIHSQKILHRDLKPENVLRTQQGTWAISDFGLARVDLESSLRLTSTSDAFGSVFYMAPEQLKGAKHVDERADIFSVGKIMQALATGRTPSGNDVPPGPLRGVILHAIEEQAARRYPSVEELLSAVESALAPTTTGEWESEEEKGQRLRSRLRGEGQVVDAGAMAELVRWSDDVGSDDGYQEFCSTLSSIANPSLRWWWATDPGELTRVITIFTELLDNSFRFDLCDQLANFGRRVVDVTKDEGILQMVVTGLALLGFQNNRWHVRDVTMAILQAIRLDGQASIALEALRMAGRDAANWTVGSTAAKTLHPILRAGLSAFL